LFIARTFISPRIFGSIPTTRRLAPFPFIVKGLLIYSGLIIRGSIEIDMAVVAAKVDATSLTIATRSILMHSLSKKIVNFLKKEDGPTAVEYAVMLALIIVVCIAAITTLGSNANNSFSFTANKLAPTAS